MFIKCIKNAYKMLHFYKNNDFGKNVREPRIRTMPVQCLPLDVDFGAIATPHTSEDTDSSVWSGPHKDLSAPHDYQRTKDIFWRLPSMENFLSPHGVLSALSCRA